MNKKVFKTAQKTAKLLKSVKKYFVIAVFNSNLFFFDFVRFRTIMFQFETNVQISIFQNFDW